MDQNKDPLEPCHLGVPSGASVLSLWYVWRKQCTNLAPTLTLSPNIPKWDSAWPTSPRSSIRCVQTNFEVCGMFGINCAPILRQDYHCLEMDQNELSLVSHHLGVLPGASKIISEPIVLWHKSCTYLAPTLTLSSNGLKWDSMTHIT
jgi:hypothetical protein